MVFDCDGLIVAPGFIDVQLNGALGVDFSTLPGGGRKHEDESADEEKGVPEHVKGLKTVEQRVDFVANKLLAFGVTGFLPTLFSSQRSVYKAILPHMSTTRGSHRHAAILGWLIVVCRGVGEG